MSSCIALTHFLLSSASGFGGAGQLGRPGSTIEVHNNKPYAPYCDVKSTYNMEKVGHILSPHPICTLLAKSTTGRMYRLKKGDKCLKVAGGAEHCLSLWELNGRRRVFVIGSNQDNRAGLDSSINRVTQFTEVCSSCFAA